MIEDPTWQSVFTALIAGSELTSIQVRWAMNEMMSGRASDAQIAGFGIAMTMKGPSESELVGLADEMLRHSQRVSIPRRVCDIVGTGGDRSDSVNVSSMSAIVAAAARVPVVKHGNRAASSKSGGADMLEALGVAIALGPEAVERCVVELGIGFCFAPRYHPALGFTAAPRRELGIGTVFNLLGPLANPAQPKVGVIGCAFEEMVPVYANAFALRRADVFIVRGHDGLDELTTSTTSRLVAVSASSVGEPQICEYTVHPRDFGIDVACEGDLRGGDAEFNADVARRVFAGERGAPRDAVLLNAGAAIAAYQGISTDDVRAHLAAGIEQAREAIDSGAAAKLLSDWISLGRAMGAG